MLQSNLGCLPVWMQGNNWTAQLCFQCFLMVQNGLLNCLWRFLSISNNCEPNLRIFGGPLESGRFRVTKTLHWLYFIELPPWCENFYFAVTPAQCTNWVIVCWSPSMDSGHLIYQRDWDHQLPVQWASLSTMHTPATLPWEDKEEPANRCHWWLCMKQIYQPKSKGSQTYS